MCDSGGGDEKKRYFLGPHEDPSDTPCALMSLETALEDLRTRFEELDPGDEVTYRLIEMTDKEVEALPEL